VNYFAGILTFCAVLSYSAIAADDTGEYYEAGFEAVMRLDQAMQEVVRFVQIEQGKLRKTRALLEELQQEHDKLRVLARADQKTVDALFELQDKRNKQRETENLVKGFLLGILSSLIASALFWFFSNRRTKANSA
jgi:hypothetical protein